MEKSTKKQAEPKQMTYKSNNALSFLIEGRSLDVKFITDSCPFSQARSTTMTGTGASVAHHNHLLTNEEYSFLLHLKHNFLDYALESTPQHNAKADNAERLRFKTAAGVRALLNILNHIGFWGAEWSPVMLKKSSLDHDEGINPDEDAYFALMTVKNKKRFILDLQASDLFGLPILLLQHNKHADGAYYVVKRNQSAWEEVRVASKKTDLSTRFWRLNPMIRPHVQWLFGRSIKKVSFTSSAKYRRMTDKAILNQHSRMGDLSDDEQQVVLYEMQCRALTSVAENYANVVNAKPAPLHLLLKKVQKLIDKKAFSSNWELIYAVFEAGKCLMKREASQGGHVTAFYSANMPWETLLKINQCRLRISDDDLSKVISFTISKLHLKKDKALS